MKPPRTVKKTCRQCGQLFTTKKCWDYRVFHCSNKCAGLSRRKPAVFNTCSGCGKLFTSKKGHRHRQKFCSRHCSSQSHVVHRRSCANCGKEFYHPINRNCSKACRSQYYLK